MQVDFSEVYKQYAKRLYLFIYSKCRNSDLAEDVVQTAFLKAILNIDSFQGTGSIYSWITKIALNVLYAEWEKPDGKNESLDKLVSDGIENIAVTDQDPIEDIIQSEERAELYSRINRLDQKQQDIVNFCPIFTFIEFFSDFSKRQSLHSHFNNILSLLIQPIYPVI